MVDTAPAPPHGRYKRGLNGADFTLEANTDDVPADGRYYVLRGGQTLVASEDFQEALLEYNRLCRDFWTERLVSEQTGTRVAAAWGLLTLDPTDKVAQAVIIRDGSAQERKRLEQAQSRRRALRSRPAPGAKAGAAAAAAGVAAATAAAAPTAPTAAATAPTPSPAE